MSLRLRMGYWRWDMEYWIWVRVERGRWKDYEFKMKIMTGILDTGY